MDAVKFIMIKNRMCEANGICANCTIDEHNLPCDCVDISESEVKEMIEIVEQWGKEHPAKTYKSDFLEKFPNVQMDDDGNIDIHWCDIFNKGKCKYKTHGSDMCDDCWEMEIEDENKRFSLQGLSEQAL